jgi:hypothetical protein
MSTEHSRDATAREAASNAVSSPLAAVEQISAIVPARNEETAIAVCIDALPTQLEIKEIIVVNDQSSDATAEIVRERMKLHPQIKMVETSSVPQGWVGKNNAAAAGAKEASQAWLLFVDADAELLPGACARAIEIANESGAGLISFSPVQVTASWYEQALIPFVYCRLAKKFSYEAVNNPKSCVAAANGQFLMIHRSVYDAIGGHASVSSEILEDVAIARRVKAAGYGLRFGPGQGIVRARMYRSFGAMWEGWKKNLYRLMGGKPADFRAEFNTIFPWVPFLLIVFGFWYPLAIIAGVVLLLLRQLRYGTELVRNRYPFRLIIYYVPAVLLYAGVLVASYRGHVKGKLAWKGRDVAVDPAGKLG